MDIPVTNMQTRTSSPLPQPAVRRAALAPHRVNTVVAYIEEHAAETVGVKKLASVVNMSPFHFARMFKGALGVPPHAYITNVRMERAKRLLSSSNLSLREIATTVGYQTQAHFTGVFHKQVGTTPRTYRLSTRGENLPMSAAPGVLLRETVRQPESLVPQL
ncbi:MAG TPA: AraC family transcriptional regulator [Usitatibacter sp.]|jgi:transcriptional regulator GlxA family with amidase domain|nr:AraC family transcriptional regulator [Usitatibacter sp.]